VGPVLLQRLLLSCLILTSWLWSRPVSTPAPCRTGCRRSGWIVMSLRL